MTRIYNWAILGAGNIARKFAADLRLLPNARLYAVGSRSNERAARFATELGIPHSYGSYTTLAGDPDIDIVYIAARHPGHYPCSLLCLDHGKHVLCEKPVAINGAQFEKMSFRARERGLFFMEALWTRFIPSFIKFRELVNEGKIGVVRIIEADFCLNIPFNPESRIYQPSLGGGSLLDIGIYPVFCALELGSAITGVSASATLSRDDIDTFCSINFTHEQGERSLLCSTIAAPGRNEALIHGSNGMLRLNRWWHTPTSLDFIPPDGDIEHFFFEEPGNGYQYEAAEVMRCLDAGKTESDLWPVEKSRRLIGLLDTIRAQAGIRYPTEVEAV